MRQKNWRLVMAGGLLIAIAVVFFFVMMSFSSQSSDPKGLLEIVGQTAGVMIGIGVAMAAIGYIGKKA